MPQALRAVVPLLMIWLSIASATAQTLVVSAASSLRDVFTEAGREFERQSPGLKLVFNFSASGVLLQQIRHGAPVDILATADAITIFARNSLVVVVPLVSNHDIRQLSDLSRLARVAIGNPATVPAGRYAQQALDAAGVKLSNVIPAEHVRQALVYVARGEVDAALVYATDARYNAGRVRVAYRPSLGEPIVYPIAIVRNSKQPVLAQAFVSLLQGPTGRELLSRHGFLLP
jgi:molybdate transport system substrate-binding protein